MTIKELIDGTYLDTARQDEMLMRNASILTSLFMFYAKKYKHATMVFPKHAIVDAGQGKIKSTLIPKACEFLENIGILDGYFEDDGFVYVDFNMEKTEAILAVHHKTKDLEEAGITPNTTLH